MLGSSLFSKKESNIKRVIDYFLTVHSVKHTSLQLEEAIDNHVESPSMLSVKDILFEYGIESVAVHKGNYMYEDFETPFICSIQQEDWSQSAFTIVTDNEGGQISYLDPRSNKITKVSLSEFNKMDKEIILLLDTEHKKDELNYK